MLDRLSPEILGRICEQLHRPGLVCLLSCSRNLNRVAIDVLYRHLTIISDDLENEIRKYSTLLERTRSWKVPRLITVTTQPRSPAANDCNLVNNAHDRLWNSVIECALQPPQKNSQAQTLIDFLRRLPLLSDLEWQATEPPAPALVTMLREEMTDCSLHLKAFGLAYGIEEKYVNSVLSLPNLRTLWFRHSDGTALRDGIQRIICASDIDEVRVFHSSTPAAPYGCGSLLVSDQETGPKSVRPLGHLRMLQLSGVSDENGQNLRRWTSVTDFNLLRTLILETIVGREDLKILAEYSFPALYSLGLAIDVDNGPDETYEAALVKVLTNVKPLSALRLTGGLGIVSLHGILKHHDPSLRTLGLIPAGTKTKRFVFDSTSIAVFKDSCRSVEELTISVSRSWDKPEEILAILDSIGNLPRLSDLDLTFDASDYALLRARSARSDEGLPDDNAFSEFDSEAFGVSFGTEQRLRKGNIRNALMNSAVDSVLAREVFDNLVSRGADKKRPLHRLSLQGIGGGKFVGGVTDVSIQEVVDEVGRGWEVEQSCTDGAIRVSRRKLDSEQVMALSWDGDDDDEGNSIIDSLPGYVDEVFRRIWPGDGDWRTQWHAFPLE